MLCLEEFIWVPYLLSNQDIRTELIEINFKFNYYEKDSIEHNTLHCLHAGGCLGKCQRKSENGKS